MVSGKRMVSWLVLIDESISTFFVSMVVLSLSALLQAKSKPDEMIIKANILNPV